MKSILSILILVTVGYTGSPQTLKIKIANASEGRVRLYSLSGENTSLLDSGIVSSNGYFIYESKDRTLPDGIYRFAFTDKWINFIADGHDVELYTDANNVADSLRILKSESTRLYYAFLKLNKEYKTKSELLFLVLARYPKEDAYYRQTLNRLKELQNEYLNFVNDAVQENPDSFVANYIRSAQLPVLDIVIPVDQHLAYLKAHALDQVDFNNPTLIYSDLFTGKTIEFLTYFRNPQLPIPLLEKEFVAAVDSILNKAKVNLLVYQHITAYLLEGFKRYGFDTVLNYIVDNYVIKDDLCLDAKTEGLIKRRMEQARIFKIGYHVSNVNLPDISGKIVSLMPFQSTQTLIVFYASWCPHCKELLPKLNLLKKSQIGKKTEIMAISLDTKKEDWINFAKSRCPDLLNVADLQGWEGKTSADYFIYATPTMFFLDNAGKIIGKPIDFEEVQKIVL